MPTGRKPTPQVSHKRFVITLLLLMALIGALWLLDAVAAKDAIVYLIPLIGTYLYGLTNSKFN